METVIICFLLPFRFNIFLGDIDKTFRASLVDFGRYAFTPYCAVVLSEILLHRLIFLPILKIHFQSQGHGALHVLIVCHMSALITNNFYMIFNPAKCD